MTEILGYKPSIEALEVTAVELKKQGSPEEQGMVDRWLDSVHQRWQDVVGAMEERKVCVDGKGRRPCILLRGPGIWVGLWAEYLNHCIHA